MAIFPKGLGSLDFLSSNESIPSVSKILKKMGLDNRYLPVAIDIIKNNEEFADKLTTSQILGEYIIDADPDRVAELLMGNGVVERTEEAAEARRNELEKANAEALADQQQRLYKAKYLTHTSFLDDLSNTSDKQSAMNILDNLSFNFSSYSIHGVSKSNPSQEGILLNAIVEQNWIIIHQLDRLNKNLEDKNR